jgi:PAS domain S-box-containing protein
MNSTRTTRWLLGATAALLVLFLLLALLAYQVGRKAGRDGATISADALPGSVAAQSIRIAASHCARHLVIAAVTEDAALRAESLAAARQTETDLVAAVERYQGTMWANAERDRTLVAQLRDQFAGFRQKRAQFEQLMLGPDRAAARAYFEHEVVPTFIPVTEAADALVAYNQNTAIDLAERIAERARILRLTMFATFGLALICGGILVVSLSAWRKEQQATRENAHRLREILDNMSSLVGLCDAEGRLIEVNQTALTAAGVQREGLLGRPLYETPWRHEDPDRNVQRQLKECVEKARQGTSSRFDVAFRTVAGDRITLDFRCDPLRDGQGRISHLLVSGIDVTERDKMKQQFLKAQRMEAIGTLSSGLAHDLNNILAPMLMAAGLLKLKLDEPRDRNIVSMIETSVQRGAGIIRQLLAFGRGQEGPLGSIQLRHLIKDIAQIVQETFPRNIEFEYNAPSTLNPITGDPTQFHQVMLNLCVNARDAMPNGGKLTLIADNVQLSAADVSGHAPAKPGAYVKLAVTDTGEGMTPQVMERIFDPFFSTKAPGKGTGLGLPSVLAIVKGHQGFLTVDSEPGRGSAFTIYIPAATQPVASQSAPPSDQLPMGSGETILVVDDEAPIRTSLREMLEAHEYRVVTANDGEEAVRLFVQNRETIKAVLCDIQMPMMSGPELVRGLRVLEPRLKFVIMTG